MMEGWYGFREAEGVTISGLDASFTGPGYTVTIFGDSNATIPVRTMNYTIGGATKTLIDGSNFSGTFADGVNQVTFTGLSTSSFTIAGNDVTTAGRSAINGIVISATAIPEPATFSLVALFGGLAFLARRRCV